MKLAHEPGPPSLGRELEFLRVLWQLDHALQCAALAEAEAASDELVAAALLHDVGHLPELDRNDGAVGDLTIDRGHEATGRRYPATAFPPAGGAPGMLAAAPGGMPQGVPGAQLSMAPIPPRPGPPPVPGTQNPLAQPLEQY